MAKDLIGKKYRDMPDAYQQRISKDEFKDRKRSQRGEMVRNLADKKYRDMPDGYQQRISKDEFQERRKAQRMAGEREELKNTKYKNLSEEERGEYGSKKEYAAKRKEAINYDPYDAEDPSGIDLRASGAGAEKGVARFSVLDARRALDSGKYTAKELRRLGRELAQDDDPYTIYGDSTKKFLKKKVAQQRAANRKKREENKGAGNQGGASTNPQKPSTDAQIDEGTSTPATGTTNYAPQTISQDRTFGNNKNRIGDNNRIYGNVNQGNQDFSVNISNQQQGGGSGTGIGVATENMMGAAAYSALNENQYDRSQAKMDATARAAETIAAAEDATGAGARIAALDEGVVQMSDFYRDQSQNYLTNLFGDYFSDEYEVPMWKPPAGPSKIDPDYDD